MLMFDFYQLINHGRILKQVNSPDRNRPLYTLMAVLMLVNAFTVQSAEPSDNVGTHLNIMGVESVLKTNILHNLSSIGQS
ncbi:MAG: hypothetical protein ACJA2G_002053 [Cognaticolwellia sp.]|jgi:hypothetical protein